jgi:hypothetical protein
MCCTSAPDGHWIPLSSRFSVTLRSDSPASISLWPTRRSQWRLCLPDRRVLSWNRRKIRNVILSILNLESAKSTWNAVFPEDDDGKGENTTHDQFRKWNCFVRVDTAKHNLYLLFLTHDRPIQTKSVHLITRNVVLLVIGQDSDDSYK